LITKVTLFRVPRRKKAKVVLYDVLAIGGASSRSSSHSTGVTAMRFRRLRLAARRGIKRR
jgi:hypothetical protein